VTKGVGEKRLAGEAVPRARFPEVLGLFRHIIIPLVLVVAFVGYGACQVLGWSTPRVRFTFESEPSGAAVYVNGRLSGTTPLVLELRADNYEVEMILEGYESWTETVEVSATPAAATVAHAKLIALKGKLTVTISSPFAWKKQTPKVGLAFDLGGLGDKSFNDSAYAGLERAIADFKLGDQETAYLEPTEGGADHEQLLRTLAKQGYGFVIANGLLFSEALSKVMAEFPNTKFAMTDGYIADLTEASNVLCWGFAEHEGSFLVGVAAAMASQTGRIGFVGGMQFPLIQKFEAGYVAGAKWINPNIKVVVNYIGSSVEAFRDPDKGKELALAQYQAGCDVVYHASGPSGAGVIAAAAEQQKWVIGVDADQYLTAPAGEQPYVLTSMMKNVDVAVYDTIEKFLKGTFVGGYATYNLAVDGVGYSASNAALTADMVARMEEAKVKIISGEIVVPTAPE